MPIQNFKCGYVALVGRPNVGKSTLLNQLVGAKVSIVSNKPQTTRRKAQGIAHREHGQVIFIDTPGVHAPHTFLDRSMLDSVRSALNEVDLIVAVVDAGHHPGELDREAAADIKRHGLDAPVLLCMNKMDRLKPEYVQPYVDLYSSLFNAEDYMLTQADRGTNVEKLMSLILDRLPERDPLYEPDEFTNQPSRVMVTEIIREKILELTRQELPYAVAISIESWEQTPSLLKIMATVVVEKPSQRGILIGKNGQMIKDIGTRARVEIELLLETKVFLDLHIRVEEGWRMNPRILHELNYRDEI